MSDIAHAILARRNDWLLSTPPPMFGLSSVDPILESAFVPIVTAIVQTALDAERQRCADYLVHLANINPSLEDVLDAAAIAIRDNLI